MMEKKHKSGFVNIVGNPNVGKSTLMNRLVGERISIITSKAQTTRHRIMGIVNTDDMQIVYSDTPGVLSPHYKLQESMLNFSQSALSDADILLYVTDVVETPDKNPEFLERVSKETIPVILLINKIDLLQDQSQLEDLVEKWKNRLPNAEVIPVSAQHKFNLDYLMRRIKELLPPSPPFFEKDALTDKPARFFVTEIIREKILQIYDKEITSLEELLLFYKNMAEKGNISLLELSRMQALLLSLKKEKNDAVNELVSKRGNLKMLLNLPEIEILLDETMLSRLDLSSLSLADLDSLLPSRPDQRLAFSILEASKANLKLQRSLSAPEFAIQGIYDRAGNFINNYFAVGLSFSVPIFNRNQGNIKSAKLEIEKSLKEKEYTENKANSLCRRNYFLQKSLHPHDLSSPIFHESLYQSADDDLEKNFNRLLEGVNENFRKRNISMLEFVDYYESYKETSLQLYETRKDVFLAMENLNTVVGRNIFNY